MKKKIKLQNLGCELCNENGGRNKKIDGVKDASINYMFQKLSIDCDDDKFDTVFESAKKNM